MYQLLMIKSVQKNLFIEIVTLTENTQSVALLILYTEISPLKCSSLSQVWQYILENLCLLSVPIPFGFRRIHQRTVLPVRQ